MLDRKLDTKVAIAQNALMVYYDRHSEEDEKTFTFAPETTKRCTCMSWKRLVITT